MHPLDDAAGEADVGGWEGGSFDEAGSDLQLLQAACDPDHAPPDSVDDPFGEGRPRRKTRPASAVRRKSQQGRKR